MGTKISASPNEPPMKRIWVAFLIVLAPILVLLGVCVGIAAREETLVEVQSPHARYVAWSSLQNHVTGYDTIVRVRDVNGAGKDGEGATKVILAFEGKMFPKDLLFVWEDESTLIIEYYGYAKPYGVKDEPWHGLNFVLRPRK